MSEERFNNCDPCDAGFEECCDGKMGNWKKDNKKEPKGETKCNLCKKLCEDQWVYIITKSQNVIFGRVDRVCDGALKLECSLAVPSCVVCTLLEFILERFFGSAAAESASYGGGNATPFTTWVCCEDIDTITTLPELTLGLGFVREMLTKDLTSK